MNSNFRIIKKRKKPKIKKRKIIKKYNYMILTIIFIIFSIIIIGIIVFKFIFKYNFFSDKKSNQLFMKNKYYDDYYNETEIIDDYLSSIPLKYDSEIKHERKRLIRFISLKILSKEKNNTEIKENLLSVFKSFSKDKNFTDIKIFVKKNHERFGNTFIMLNNLIYYCEVLGFKNNYLRKAMVDYEIIP